MPLVTAVRAALVSACLLPTSALAVDRWESGSSADDDSPTTTRNELRHGDRQKSHDLEGTPAAPDRDYYIVRTQIYHTYEAIVRSVTLFWGMGTPFCVPPGGTSVCPRFDRVLEDGVTVVREGVPDGVQNNNNRANALRIHMYGTGTTNYLRVTGDTGGSAHTAADQYDIELRDTTYAVPRFNNSGTQTTILLVQNTGDAAVATEAWLFAPDGTVVTAYQRVIPSRGVWVQPLAANTQAQGVSGSVLVRHEGAYGSLTGKAVSLEPATGFTFDTAMTPMPF